MTARRKPFSMDHPVIVLFVIIAVIASMSLAAEVLKPLALSILLAFALSPVVRAFERRGLPRVPSVILTCALALGVLGGVSVVVFNQINALAADLPKYRLNILRKVRMLPPSEENNLDKASKVLSEAVEALDEPKFNPNIQDVRVVEQPTFRDRLETAVGPYLEFIGLGTFVLILVLFLLMGREDLRDRIVQLFGRRWITLTTRTIDDVGQRISRYLGMFATVNSAFGLTVGVGLWALGVPFAVLWGFLAGMLRFIPYVGPAAAFGLPLIFSFAHSEGIWQPLSVVALFLVLEIVLNSLEPVLYGRTTGVSALSLLVAAMFWTWLWGVLGLLLSTPLTVCLAVLGKYVPSLNVFSILLGEEAELDPDVRFYQRLLAFEQDEATEIVEQALAESPLADVYDRILIPSLSRAERDFARGEIDESEQAFIWRVIGEIVEETDATSGAGAVAAPRVPPGELAPSSVIGLAVNDRADAMVLNMLRQLLASEGVPMEILASNDPPLKLTERLAERDPKLLIVSHLPPVGLTSTRYLVRRLRARLDRLPILVGRWGDGGNTEATAKRLSEVGASRVVFRLADARDKILNTIAPRSESEAGPAPIESAPALV